MRGQPVRGEWLQGAALAAILGTFLVAPTALIPKEAFFPGRTFTLSLFASLFDNPVLMRSLGNSVLIGLAATALALPFAALIGRHVFPGRGLIRAGVMIPLLLPPFAGTLAVKQFLGRYGSLNLLPAGSRPHRPAHRLPGGRILRRGPPGGPPPTTSRP